MLRGGLSIRVDSVRGWFWGDWCTDSKSLKSDCTARLWITVPARVLTYLYMLVSTCMLLNDDKGCRYIYICVSTSI
jgi:hypothetical protein